MSKIGDVVLYVGNTRGLQQWASYTGRRGEVTAVDEYGNVESIKWDDGHKWPTRPKEWNLQVVDTTTPLQRLIESKAAFTKANAAKYTAVIEEEKTKAAYEQALTNFNAWVTEQARSKLQ